MLLVYSSWPILSTMSVKYNPELKSDRYRFNARTVTVQRYPTLFSVRKTACSSWGNIDNSQAYASPSNDQNQRAMCIPCNLSWNAIVEFEDDLTLEALANEATRLPRQNFLESPDISTEVVILIERFAVRCFTRRLRINHAFDDFH